MTKFKIALFFKKIALRAIGLYKLLSLFTRPTCRFIPSCSDYAQEAVTKHGLLKGAKLTILRIIKCRPFGNYGVDMVPDAIERRKK